MLGSAESLAIDATSQLRLIEINSVLQAIFTVRIPTTGVVHRVTFSKSIHISTCDSKVGTQEMGRKGAGAYRCPASANHCDKYRFYPTIHNLMHSIDDARIFARAFEFVVAEREQQIPLEVRRSQTKYRERLALIKAEARVICGGISQMPTLAREHGQASAIDLKSSFGMQGVLHPDVSFIKRFIFASMQLCKQQDDLTKRSHTAAYEAFTKNLMLAHGKNDIGVCLQRGLFARCVCLSDPPFFANGLRPFARAAAHFTDNLNVAECMWGANWKKIVPELEETLEQFCAPVIRRTGRVLLQALSLRPASEERLAAAGMRSRLQVLCWGFIALYRNLSALTVSTKKSSPQN